MRKHTLFACLFLSLFTTVYAQKNLQQKILDLEHQWVDVALKQNATAFASMMSDDYVRMNTNGTVGIKKPWVDAIRTGNTKYDWVNLFDTEVKLHGNTAVVTGKFTQKATKNGEEEVVFGSFMNTWQQQKGKWVVIASAFYKDDVNNRSAESDSAQIIALEHQWVQVAIDGNAEAFAAIMADNYVGLYPNGALGRKQGWVNNISSGKSKYEYVKLTNLKVYLNGETAVVTGKYDEKVLIAGKERLSKGSYMSTWAKVAGNWRIVANAFTDDPM